MSWCFIGSATRREPRPRLRRNRRRYPCSTASCSHFEKCELRNRIVWRRCDALTRTHLLFALSVASVISCSKMKGFEQEATEKTESVRQVFCVSVSGLPGPSYIETKKGLPLPV